MTNELTDVRCPCGAEFQADSYDAGFIAGSGMCQNCDAALPPKDICTCPSGDGSLRWPCPKHPAVEQAGGDEREAAIAKFAETCPMTAESAAGGKSYDIELRRYYLLGWDDRAALAQPSPTTDSRPAEWSSYDPTWVVDFIRDNSIFNADLVERMLEYATRPAGDVPQAEQAEAERPEVEEVSEFEREDIARSAFETAMADGISLDSFLSLSNTLAARYDRIVGELRAENAKLIEALDECDGDRWKLRSERDAANARLHEVATACATAEQQRDAALARCAELEAKLSDPTAVHQWQFSNAWFDCSKEALLKAGKEGSPIRTLYTAPAQAQHRMPDLLARAEDFVSGFEDDDEQEGVSQLLADLRIAIGRAN
ncbi:hypothetical protein N0517_10785 [Pseudomonas aeruginosa]|nr:hypothetical protein [Pseudomonas aeruginosa]MCS9421243.1 hypothetical protein [Pseudomonas aeruginosa]MCS9546904.1 hypothetical protein [Pseudomonas aeruginosa]